MPPWCFCAKKAFTFWRYTTGTKEYEGKGVRGSLTTIPDSYHDVRINREGTGREAGGGVPSPVSKKSGDMWVEYRNYGSDTGAPEKLS
jgi:hypothetical protein